MAKDERNPREQNGQRGGSQQPNGNRQGNQPNSRPTGQQPSPNQPQPSGDRNQRPVDKKKW